MNPVLSLIIYYNGSQAAISGLLETAASNGECGSVVGFCCPLELLLKELIHHRRKSLSAIFGAPQETGAKVVLVPPPLRGLQCTASERLPSSNDNIARAHMLGLLY